MEFVNVPMLKASGVNSVVDVLRKMAQPDDFMGFIEKLPPRARSLVLTPPLAMTWVPTVDMADIFAAAHEHLFGRNDAKMEELGVLQIRADLSGIYRVFLRVASPAYILAKVAQVYETYTRSCGTVKVTAFEPGYGELLVEGRPYPSQPFWRYLAGNVRGTLALAGCREPSVTILGGGGDESWARFRGQWR